MSQNLKRRLLIFWIGVSKENRQFGGAAGSRSFLANYIIGQANSSDIAMNLMVIAHEQFHQLTELCVPEDVSLPVWVNESLAQYYGLKSLSHINLPPESVSITRKRFIDPKREIEHGLVELSRKYKQGDRTVYPLFYSQGATFWADVDRELSAAHWRDQVAGRLFAHRHSGKVRRNRGAASIHTGPAS